MVTKLEGRGFVTAVPGVSLSGGGRRPVGELQDVAGELVDGFSKRALWIIGMKAPRVGRPGTSLVVQWLTLRLPIQGVYVRSLVGELRSLMAKKPKHKTETIM